MREYLFRGQTIDNKQWVHGSLIIQGEYYFILPTEWPHPSEEIYIWPDTGIIDGHVIPVIPETLGRFTGLPDANKQRIFEGDILQFGVYRLIVYWNEEDFQWAAKKTRGYDIVHFRHENPRGFWNSIDLGEIAAEEIITGKMTTVVIGNIYDNADLIEDESPKSELTWDF